MDAFPGLLPVDISGPSPLPFQKYHRLRQQQLAREERQGREAEAEAEAEAGGSPAAAAAAAAAAITDQEGAAGQRRQFPPLDFLRGACNAILNQVGLECRTCGAGLAFACWA